MVKMIVAMAAMKTLPLPAKTDILAVVTNSLVTTTNASTKSLCVMAKETVWTAQMRIRRNAKLNFARLTPSFCAKYVVFFAWPFYSLLWTTWCCNL